jgi:HlyD family secretion protein
MSTTLRPAPRIEEAGVEQHTRKPRRGGGEVLKTVGIWLLIAAPIAAALWYGIRAYRALASTQASPIPVTQVKRGDVTLTITARGELRGGNSEMIIAPMTGGEEAHITYLRQAGETVKPGDVVVKLDTTEQVYKLREAQADAAEAEQHIAQARAQMDAQKEEDSYALLKARSDVRLAELEVRRNPLVAEITAKQNDMALAQAREHLAQLQKNLVNHEATNQAAIATQEAARSKSEVQVATAKQNIDAMSVAAHRAGYVALKQAITNMMYPGMVLPRLQVGDAVRPGMAIAEIPDLTTWEVVATIAELDRGHLAAGQQAEVRIVPVPEHPFAGRIKDLGGTTGPPWDRHFDCRIALESAAPELRPGMSARIVVTTEVLQNVLWIPAQALFDKDGKTFVYVKAGTGFAPRDVKLVRKSESQAVITGLSEHQTISLTNPEEQAKKSGPAASSASQAIHK